MAVIEKIKTIENNIEQNKAQYNLDIETAIISVLSSKNVGKYNFLTVEDVLIATGPLVIAATIKKF